MTDVYIIGCKGIPARYGGFETFVEKLTEGKKSEQIKYHVSCMANTGKRFEHNGADCFEIAVPLKGPAGRILQVASSLKFVAEEIKRDKPERVIVYVLGCRIGPLMKKCTRRLKKLGATVLCNPDGLEWKRAKWSGWQKKFLKFCEKCLVTNSDLSICDSVSIEKYIKQEYEKYNLKTTFIAYGADLNRPGCDESALDSWLSEHGLERGEYYLIVGRFVPENNYETMIREFMRSDTKKKLAIITNVEHNKFYDYLAADTGFAADDRINFVGTVYDSALLSRIREEAFAYIHGHEVGGTNPSLLEALSATELNLLLDVGFNREVAEESALYWTKDAGSLANLISKSEQLNSERRKELGDASTDRIRQSYNWDKIITEYEKIFLQQF